MCNTFHRASTRQTELRCTFLKVTCSVSFCVTTPFLAPYLRWLAFTSSFPNLIFHLTLNLYSYLPYADAIKRATYLATLDWLPAPSLAHRLKFIQFASAGINHVAKHPIYTDTKIPLCSANGVHGPQIAEWVVMMDLVHSHNYVNLYEQQRRKEWNQRTGMSVRDNVGRRVGILGYGSIGRQGM